jgi:hypothetical protein
LNCWMKRRDVSASGYRSGRLPSFDHPQTQRRMPQIRRFLLHSLWRLARPSDKRRGLNVLARGVSSQMKPLIAYLLSSSLLSSQDSAKEPPLFRATADLVMVDVQVVHKKTKTSTASLMQRDFEVREDGVQQQILFSSRDELPLSLVLLFDASVRPILKDLAGGASAALAHLKAGDEAAVMSYAPSARVISDFTTDRVRTVSAIEEGSRDRQGSRHFSMKQSIKRRRNFSIQRIRRAAA